MTIGIQNEMFPLIRLPKKLLGKMDRNIEIESMFPLIRLPKKLLGKMKEIDIPNPL